MFALAQYEDALNASAAASIPRPREPSTQRVSPWWSELHRVAKIRANRATGFKGTIAARVWEKQKRGLAHMHGVLSVSTPAELRVG